RSPTGSVVDERFARAGNGQNSFHQGSTNILGALIRQRRWRQANAAGTHVGLFPKRAHPRTGSRVRGIGARDDAVAPEEGVAKSAPTRHVGEAEIPTDGTQRGLRCPFCGRLLPPCRRRRPLSLIRKVMAASTRRTG